MSAAVLAMTSWGTAWRMTPPSSTECSLASLLAPGARRCRFKWTGLSSLLSLAAGGANTVANLHIDARNDVCTGAPATGGARLSATDAAYAAPIASVWLESPLMASIMNGMRTCEMDADCASIPNSVCIDMEELGAGVLQVRAQRAACGTTPLRVASQFIIANTSQLAILSVPLSHRLSICLSFSPVFPL